MKQVLQPQIRSICPTLRTAEDIPPSSSSSAVPQTNRPAEPCDSFRKPANHWGSACDNEVSSPLARSSFCVGYSHWRLRIGEISFLRCPPSTVRFYVFFI